MSQGDHSTATGLQTIELQVPGANCPWCFDEPESNSATSLDGVADVRASIVGECIEVRHRDVPSRDSLTPSGPTCTAPMTRRTSARWWGVEPHVASSCGCTRSTSLAGDRPEPARPMETLVEAMKRLRSSGYTHELRRIGRRQPRLQRLRHQPRTRGRGVRETVRFEGDSNPDDEAILSRSTASTGVSASTAQRSSTGTAAADVKALERLTQHGDRSRSSPISRGAATADRRSPGPHTSGPSLKYSPEQQHGKYQETKRSREHAMSSRPVTLGADSPPLWRGQARKGTIGHARPPDPSSGPRRPHPLLHLPIPGRCKRAGRHR